MFDIQPVAQEDLTEMTIRRVEAAHDVAHNGSFGGLQFRIQGTRRRDQVPLPEPSIGSGLEGGVKKR